MKIEVGKKYVDGMGEIRTIIREAENAAFPFADSEGDTFTASGRYSESTRSPLDLIREYTEPAQTDDAPEIESLLSHIQYFPEINMNNYSEGQVRELNDCGIATFLVASAMQSASHEPVSEPSGQCQTITTQVTVVPTGEPIFSEQATNIIMDDEAGGQFIRVEQNHDEKGIIIELKEWPAIRDAIDAMVASAEKMGDSK